MEMSSLRGLVLVCTLVLTVHGSATNKRSSWLHAIDKPLERYARDLPFDGGDPGSCRALEQCFHTAARISFEAAVNEFRLGELYSLTNDLCEEKKTCIATSCGNTFLKSYIGMQERIIDWVCANKDGLRAASMCFQDPFPQSMRNCGTSVSEDVVDIRNYMSTCVQSALDHLPLCTADSRRFFLSMFDFVMGEQMAAYEDVY